MDDRYRQGFTLVELLVALAISLILMTSAIPGMSSIIERQRLYSAAEVIAADLRLVRNAALAHDQQDITVSFITGNNWCYGVAQSRCDCHAPITAHDSCTLPNSSSLQHFTRHAASFSHITMNNARFFRGNQVQFEGIRGLSQPGTITLENASGQQLAIKVSLMGRARICSPQGQHNVRYASC